MKTFGLWLKMAGLCLMFALAFPACSDDYVYTFKFNGNSCTGASCSVTCPTEQIAQMVYENLDAEDKVLFKLSGKTLTCNKLDYYIDLNKDDIKRAMQAMGGMG